MQGQEELVCFERVFSLVMWRLVCLYVSKDKK
jgi:hypothetical protein